MPATRKDSQVSVRLPVDLKDKMEAYAAITGRTKSYVAMEALSVYLEGRIPQIEDLQEAVRDADHGELASDDEAEAVFAKYAAVKPSQAKAKPAMRRRVS